MKAIASDFDGTVFFGYLGVDGNGFKEKDLEAIQQFQKAGNQFGICTGRPLHGLLYASKEAIEQKKIHYDFYIVSTGAVILDENLNVLYENRFPVELANEIVETYKHKIQVYAHVGNEKVYAMKQKGNFPIPQNVANSIQDIQDKPIYGISIGTGKEEIAQEIYQELIEKYEDVLSINLNASDIDIVNKGVSKGRACEILKEMMEFDTLYGIGDNFNDIPMLSHTDHSFTFTYSPKEVQDKANQVVESLEKAIESIL